MISVHHHKDINFSHEFYGDKQLISFGERHDVLRWWLTDTYGYASRKGSDPDRIIIYRKGPRFS